MRDQRTSQTISMLGTIFQDMIALVRALIPPSRLTPVPVSVRRWWASGTTQWKHRSRLTGWLALAVGFVLLAATPVWADPQALPAGVPNIYDPAVQAHFRPVGAVNLGGNADFPVVLLMGTSEEEPQALLFGLDARNGKATWSLTTDPIILIVVVSDDPAIQNVYVDIGFADVGWASGAFAAVGDVNSPVLPELLRAVFAAQPGTKI